jgi:mannosyltransferase
MKNILLRIKEKPAEMVIPVLLFCVAFLWKFLFIGVRDVCIDEPFTIFNAQKSIREILLLPTQNEPNPPLFMFILHGWINLFGISREAVRMVPLLFNALTPVFIYLTGKKLSNVWGGIIAAGLFILSSYQFYFGMETRTYSMLLCATAAAIWFLFSLLRDPGNRKWLIGLTITNIVLVYSHYFGWFVVFMEFMTWIFYIRNRLLFRGIFISLLITGITFIPMFITFVRQFFISKKQTWVKPPEASAYWRELIMFLNNPKVIWAIAAVLVIGALLFLLRKKKEHFPVEYLLLFFFWVMPYTVMFFVSSKVPMFENRYVMYNSIGLYLTIGTLAGYLFSNSKFLLPAASVVMLAAMGFYMQTRIEFIAYRETGKAVEFAKSRRDQSTLTLVYPHWNDYEFAYYFDRNIFRDVANFEPRLRDSLVYQVWGLDDVKNYLPKFSGKDKIVYFRGGSGYRDINNYLDSVYVRKDSTFFPDCYFIFTYQKKQQPEN